MEKNFAIVKFPSEDDAVGVICRKWIKNDDFCYYPNINYEKHLKRQSTPTIDWRICSIKVLKEYGTCNEARQHLKKAEETSNLESDVDAYMEKRKRIPPKTYSSDEEFHHLNNKPSKISKYPHLETFNSESQSILRNNYMTTSMATPSSPKNNSLNENIPVCSFTINSSPKAASTPSLILEPDNAKLMIVIGQMQSTIADLVQEVKTLHGKIDAMSANSIHERHDEDNSSEMSLIGKLPLATLEEFLIFEEKLREVKFYNLLVKVLVSLGGRDIRKHTYNMLRRIMICELANCFSFTGKQAKTKENEKKQAFVTTQVYKCIQAALRRVYPKLTDDVLKTHISLWLQQAKHRISRKEQISVVPETYGEEY